MKVTSVVHAYPPVHGSGAEWMLHRLHRYLQNCGHEVLCQSKAAVNDHEFDGVSVVKRLTVNDVQQSDVLLTHLGSTGRAINYAGQFGKPVVWIAHNSHRYAVIAQKRGRIGVVYNSEFVESETGHFYANKKSMVLRPPVFIDDYKVNSRRTHVTLVNHSQLKGGGILRHIAEALPDVQFLAVDGAYGVQVTDYPGNVTIVENTDDIKVVYRQSKAVILPSQYESYGRVAGEALCSGIPVLAHDLPGLRECCGETATYVPFNDIEAWIKAVSEIDVDYKTKSDQSRQRAQHNHDRSVSELAEFEAFIQSI